MLRWETPRQTEEEKSHSGLIVSPTKNKKIIQFKNNEFYRYLQLFQPSFRCEYISLEEEQDSAIRYREAFNSFMSLVD